MTTRLKLKPGQKGTKKLVKTYGDDLICVRYRYDEESRTRIKTVEIVVERIAWTPPSPSFADEEIVPVRIAFAETACKQFAKEVGGKWDPEAKVWMIPYGKVKETILEKHLILDAGSRERTRKSI